jgi:hypothetical protein
MYSSVQRRGAHCLARMARKSGRDRLENAQTSVRDIMRDRERRREHEPWQNLAVSRPHRGHRINDAVVVTAGRRARRAWTDLLEDSVQKSNALLQHPSSHPGLITACRLLQSSEQCSCSTMLSWATIARVTHPSDDVWHRTCSKVARCAGTPQYLRGTQIDPGRGTVPHTGMPVFGGSGSRAPHRCRRRCTSRARRCSRLSSVTKDSAMAATGRWVASSCSIRRGPSGLVTDSCGTRGKVLPAGGFPGRSAHCATGPRSLRARDEITRQLQAAYAAAPTASDHIYPPATGVTPCNPTALLVVPVRRPPFHAE